jgi:hypothetical protein
MYWARELIILDVAGCVRAASQSGSKVTDALSVLIACEAILCQFAVGATWDGLFQYW